MRKGEMKPCGPPWELNRMSFQFAYIIPQGVMYSNQDIAKFAEKVRRKEIHVQCEKENNVSFKLKFPLVLIFRY
jgi:hypothetical protein